MVQIQRGERFFPSSRMKEHKAGCRLAHFERSAVAEHAWQAGHEIEQDDVEILHVDTAIDLQKRKVKAVYIRLAPKGLKKNREEGRSSPTFESGPSRKFRRSCPPPPHLI